jgi:ribosomal protein L4
VLVILENTNGDEAKSFRNIENVLVTSARSLNTYNILISDYLVFTKNSLTELVGG